jgi:hypothetical protein
VRILVTKHFRKWASKHSLSDLALAGAVSDLSENKSVNQLGKFLFKIRVRSSSSGKSGGFRTIVVAVENDRVFFVYGFAKNEKDNLNKSELDGFKQLAKTYAALSVKQISQAIKYGELFEVLEP